MITTEPHLAEAFTAYRFTIPLTFAVIVYGVLWAGFMLAYIAGSPLQGALIMAVFALTSGAGLQLVSSLRQALSGRVGDALMLRASGLIILLGLGVMLGRQAGFISSPVWMESMGFCL